MYLTETHLHTSESSPCGRLSAEEMLRLYKSAGVTTVCITDHYSQGGFDRMGLTDTTQREELILRGYRVAKKVAASLNMHVILSAEFQLYNCFENHYLVYGIEENFFAFGQDILALSVSDFSRYCHNRGAYIVQAHPYRPGCQPTPEYVDAMESINGKAICYDATEETRTEEIARLYELPLTAGSDAHGDEDHASALIVTATPIITAKDYIQALCTGNYMCRKNHT